MYDNYYWNSLIATHCDNALRKQTKQYIYNSFLFLIIPISGDDILQFCRICSPIHHKTRNSRNDNDTFRP